MGFYSYYDTYLLYELIQQVIFGKTMPMLFSVISAFKNFITKWEKVVEGKLNLLPMVQKGLMLAYKYYNHMNQTRAYIVTICK